MTVELPHWVYEKELERRRGDLTRQERYWNPILQGLDPHLRLTAPMDHPPAGMVAQRWHLTRINEAGVEHYIPVMGRHGEYREMDWPMFEALKRRDMHNARAKRMADEERARGLKAAERDKARRKEDRVGEIVDRAESSESVSIQVPKKVIPGKPT